LSADPDILSAEKESEVRSSFSRQGLMQLLGAEMTMLGRGRCAVALPFSDNVAQQHGFFHGGVVGAIGDNAGGYAALTMLPLGTEVLTLEYKVNFLKPAAGDLLVAEGLVLRAGRSVIVCRVDIFVETSGRRSHCAALQQSLMPAPARPG